MAQTSLNSTGVASSGALSLQSNGTTEAIGISTGQVATLAQNPILTSGTANGVAYLNGSKVLTTGSALVFDGSNLGLGVTSPTYKLDLSIGSTTGAKLFRFSGGTTGKALFGYVDNGGVGITNSDPYTSGVMYYQTGSAHNWYTGSTQAMTLDASGNLLVGTTSATEKLTVNGRVACQWNAYANGGATSYSGDATSLVTGSSAGMWAARSDSALLFSISSAEKARIDSSGNLLVGKTSTDGLKGSTTGIELLPNSSSNFVADSNEALLISRRGTDGSAQVFRKATTTVGSISVTTTATAYNTSSDYRLKNITGPVTGAKDFIMALQPKQGTWKADGSPFVGFVAHEFQEVSPSSVSGEKDAVDADGNPIMQAMQASSPEVMANLVAYIQELEARITALEA